MPPPITAAAADVVSDGMEDWKEERIWAL